MVSGYSKWSFRWLAGSIGVHQRFLGLKGKRKRSTSGLDATATLAGLKRVLVCKVRVIQRDKRMQVRNGGFLECQTRMHGYMQLCRLNPTRDEADLKVVALCTATTLSSCLKH